jgi:phosphatidate cytidylyltransferase
MLRQRLIVAFILIPILVVVIVLGGYFYLLTVLLAFGLAAWEYTRLFQTAALRPALPLLVGGVLLLTAAGWFPALNPHEILLAGAVLAALTWHLLDFEHGATTSGTDFCVTVAGILYLGALGGSFAALRRIPQGLWWILAGALAVNLADSAAYICGRLWGKHKLAPRLSPNKTWEGYAGGAVVSVIGVCVFVLVLQALGVTEARYLTWPIGVLLGLLVGLLGPLGDLGVSMFKRQMGVKDTGNLLPGHGGMLDRIDSWLVAVPLTYFLALLLQH